MEQKNEPQSTQKSTEMILKRYWLPIYNRCLRLLNVASVARDAAIGSFAELDDQTREQSEIMEDLYRISTGICLENLTGNKRRNTDWLRALENQKSGDKQTMGKAEQRRQNLLDLLEMSQANMRPLVLYRFLEGLDLGSTAILCNISEAAAKAEQEKFIELSSGFLQDKGLEPVAVPDDMDCPDAFVMDRLSTDEESGLEDAKSHLAQHESCLKTVERMKSENQGQSEDMAQVLNELRLASQRLSEEKKGHDFVKSSEKKLLLPALVAALATGALLWALLPSTQNMKGAPSDFLGYRLMLLVDENGKQREIQSGEALAPGQQLGIMLSSPKSMSVRILALGEKGKPKSVLPPEVFSWPENSTDPQRLPFSYKIGKKPGTERVFALFCPQEGMLKYLEQALEFAYPIGVDGSRNLERDLQGAPARCEMRSVLIRRKTPEIIKN